MSLGLEESSRMVMVVVAEPEEASGGRRASMEVEVGVVSE